MALAQAGYDSIDDARGVLIKTAGYPGGFFGPINFGTVSFLAKKPGNGIIKIGAASLVLDGANLNVFKDTFAQSSIEITSSQPPAEQTVPLVKEVVPAPAETAVPVPAPASTLVPVPVPSTRLTPTIFDILTQPGSEQSSGNLWIPILFGAVILVLAVGGYMIYRKRRKKVYNGK